MHEIKKKIRFMLYVMVVMASVVVILCGIALKQSHQIQALEDHVDSMDLKIPDVSE